MFLRLTVLEKATRFLENEKVNPESINNVKQCQFPEHKKDNTDTNSSVY